MQTQKFETFQEFLDAMAMANGNVVDLVYDYGIEQIAAASVSSHNRIRVFGMLDAKGVGIVTQQEIQRAIDAALRQHTNLDAGPESAYRSKSERLLQDLAKEDVDDGAEELSPLVVDDAQRLPLGWLDDYTAIMTELTGSPPEFNQLAALVTVATAIQRNARLRMAFGDIYPNIFGCIVAASSVYHKSSCLGKPRLLLQRADLEKLLLSELMTSEGLLKQLSGQPAGIVIRDEIGTLFSSGRIRYLAALKPDLTALFDCAPYSRVLASGEIKLPAPYLNILGATTPGRFYESITLLDWQDGFLPRWLFVVPEGEPDFEAASSVYEEEHDREIGRLAGGLVNVARNKQQDFVLLTGAFDRWDRWQRDARRQAFHYGDEPTMALVNRYGTYALKFAMILAAINNEWGRISEPTMATAIGLADRYKRYAYHLLSERENYGVSGSKMQKCFAIIKAMAREKGYVTRKTLMQFGHFKAGDLDPVLAKLVEIGAVIEQASATGLKKRYAAVAEELPIKSWR